MTPSLEGVQKYPWGHDRRFNDLSGSLKKHFGFRVQKLSIDAGFTCPNRDGSKGVGGCTFCNNQTFSPAYCSEGEPVTIQLERGKNFFSGKYPDSKYLAYFQAYTNTYDRIDHLKALYEEALSVPDIVGLVIGTRPDCISSELLDYLEELARRTFLVVEYGVESTYDHTLQRINRGHDFKESVTAITETASRGIMTGAHLILGLPGETMEMLTQQVEVINSLPLHQIKFHQLQIIRRTVMEIEYQQHPEDFSFLNPDEYTRLVVGILERLRPDLIVERFVSTAPVDMIASPRWRLKNHEMVAKIDKELERLDTWQGKYFNQPAAFSVDKGKG